MRWFVLAVLVITLVALTGLLITWLRTRSGTTAAIRHGTEEVLLANGAARCVAAARLLRALTGRSGELPTAWDQIELPLLQALPDCPPDYKIELINALDSAAKSTGHRETSRRILTLRNSMLA